MRTSRIASWELGVTSCLINDFFFFHLDVWSSCLLVLMWFVFVM